MICNICNNNLKEFYNIQKIFYCEDCDFSLYVRLNTNKLNLIYLKSYNNFIMPENIIYYQYNNNYLMYNKKVYDINLNNNHFDLSDNIWHKPIIKAGSIIKSLILK